jgi:hypothetical protein
MAPSGQSLLMPEIEQHDFAAIVAEFERDAVLVLALDVGRHFADDQIADLEKCRSGLGPYEIAVWRFDGTIFFNGRFDKANFRKGQASFQPAS